MNHVYIGEKRKSVFALHNVALTRDVCECLTVVNREKGVCTLHTTLHAMMIKKLAKKLHTTKCLSCAPFCNKKEGSIESK